MKLDDRSCDLLILQPAIRPERSGVTDHSLALAAVLAERGINTAHVDVADPTGRRMALEIEARAILLQLSVYGYAPRALAAWLPPFVADYRRRHPTRVWLTYCHELWVFRPPVRRSAFWARPLQQRVCNAVIDQSDTAFLNSAWAYDLARERIGDRAVFMPTASNVGEPNEVRPSHERPPCLAVFGSAASRQACYAKLDQVVSLMSRLGLDRIVDIGEPLPRIPQVPADVRFHTTGSLPAAGVSRHLGLARAGLFETQWGMASKSGVFAAYQAHGVVPVSIHDAPDPRYRGAPGPERGIDFGTLEDSASDLPNGGDVLSRYRRYGFDVLAAELASRALS